ncbi:MAG: energy-coupling factor transporter transmembrane protein EcfT [Synergistaceae bacterium]|jgi:energy-coupling factor transport system permease protein|nr:energy-coupling factor transporter transmembrane protein EcfT [Synergistaceae bacterium]
MKLSGGFSIGQFIPGESYIHSLDPRCKIIGAFILFAAPFIAKSPYDFIPIAFALAAITRLARIKLGTVLRSGRPVVFLVALTIVLNVFWTPGRELARLGPLSITEEGVTLAFCVGLRLYFLVMLAALLMMTTSPMAFAGGLESILSPLAALKFPVSEMAMMMTIALRFIPTFFEETDKILKAQISRGADFESGGIIKRARAFIPVLVPLFVLVFARAENLAIAMESRGYVPGVPRSRLNPLVWAARETTSILCVIVFIIFTVLWNRYAPELISLWLGLL